MRFLDLGVLRVEIDGLQVTPGGRRPAAVLNTLLLHLNRRVSVDTLLDAVWGENVSSSAAGTLETHIWRLRRLLEPGRARREAASIVINDSGGYRLMATSDQVDSARFEQLGLDVVDLLATGQPERALRVADEALGLWRGRPFEDLSDRLWAAGPVARLDELHVQLEERRVDAILAVDRPAQALSELEPLLAEHPLRERLWWQRILALYRAGRTDEALQAYRRARQTLIDEIGLEPGIALKELHGKILNQDSSLDAPAPRRPVAPVRVVEPHLPRSWSMVGRDREQEQVSRALIESRLVTVVGAAGAGKTRLATEVAWHAAERFPDGVWFVDLSSVDADTEVAMAVAATLNLAVPPTSTPVASLTAYIRGRRVLVLLDNCEQVADGVAELCEALVEQAHEVGILATSREPIGLPEETVYPLDPLPVDQSTGESVASVAHPRQSPAVALFCQRDRSRRAGPPSDTDLDAVIRICRAVDGNPLAIELAAALTPTYSLLEIAEQVERDPGQLATIGRGQARHHQSLHAAIERSYRLLPADEQMLYRRLAVVPGTFPRELAEALADGHVQASVGGLLARLSHRSLLTATRATGETTRFAQHATIRSHAARALTSSDDYARAEWLRDQWTLDLAHSRPRAGRPEEADWYARVSANLPTIRATLHRRLVVQRDPVGADVAHRLLGYWYYYGLIDEGRRWVESALGQSGESESTPALNRGTLACLLLHQGLTDRARAEFDRTLAELPAELDQPLTTGDMLLAVSSAFALPQDYAAMKRGLDAVRPILADTSDPDLEVGWEAVACLAEWTTTPLAQTAARARRNYDAAIAVPNLWAAWLSCSSVNTVALAERDAPTGLTWSRRLINLQDRLGARTVLTHLETLADFLALNGHLEQAVRVFSATHHAARRAGMSWPRNQLTAELLQRAQHELSAAMFDGAWAVGPTLNRRQLIGDDEPIS